MEVLEVHRFEADRDFRDRKKGTKILTLILNREADIMLIHMFDEGQDFIVGTMVTIDQEGKTLIIDGYRTTEFQVLTLGKK